MIREMLDATNREYPKFVVFENVPGMLSSNKGNDFVAALDMKISLLAAYGIPCFKYYDLDGGAGKVINGFSGYGASLYVPQSRLEEAQELLQAQPVEDEETEQHA